MHGADRISTTDLQDGGFVLQSLDGLQKNSKTPVIVTDGGTAGRRPLAVKMPRPRLQIVHVWDVPKDDPVLWILSLFL